MTDNQTIPNIIVKKTQTLTNNWYGIDILCTPKQNFNSHFQTICWLQIWNFGHNQVKTSNTSQLSESFCICLSNPCPIYEHISAGRLDYHSGGRLAAACTCWKSSSELLREVCVCVCACGWRGWWCWGIDLILIGPWKEHDLTAFSWEYIWALSTICSPSLHPFSIIWRALSLCLSLFDTQCLWTIQKALNVSLMTLWILG